MKKLLILGIGVAVSLIACEPTQPQVQIPVLGSGLYLENMDTTVNPGDNFQFFVNGTWINNTEIPADKSSYGTMGILHEESQENVKMIIEDCASGDFASGSDEQKVGDLYSSYMNMDKRNELGVTPLAASLEKIEAISSHADVILFFAYANKNGITSPVGGWVYPDMKKPTEYALYSWQGGLGLPDREYYLSEDEKFSGIRTSYMEHVALMFELAGFVDGVQSASVVIDVETKIASNHIKKEETRDRVKMYNNYPVDSLDSLMPNWDWVSYFNEIGTPNLKNIIITQPSYILSLDDLLPAIEVSEWKTYLKWAILDNAASQLSVELDEQNFNFYSKTLRGTEEQLPQWRRGVNVVNGNLGEVVGKVYVSKYFVPAAKERMTELVANLVKAYEISIKELDWMGEETKAEALNKLSKFTPKIGYPEKWRDYSSLEIKADDLYGNLKRSNLAEHNKEIAKIGQPIDPTEWAMTPQTVNAYYSPALNEVVFPAAILQPPFFDMTVDDATNYGAIGAVIGHEMGHGFDDQGSATDGDGVLRDWWTDADKEEFNSRTSALVDQYSGFKVFEDLNVNGEFTLGENIGDLGGMTIAIKAYQMSLNGKEPEVIDGFTGMQRLFLGWGQAWRGKSREKALRMQVSTDPHSPRDFRVNGVLSNIPEFYEAFDVQPGDSLYLAPEDRVKIW
ncbi:MAG: M13 family peptidase [Reichenbachiella sp.]